MPSYHLSPEKLVVAGHLDTSQREFFYQHALKLLSQSAKEVTLDLRNVTHITSDCIGVVVSLWLDARQADKTLRICPSNSARELLVLGGLDKVIHIVDEP